MQFFRTLLGMELVQGHEERYDSTRSVMTMMSNRYQRGNGEDSGYFTSISSIIKQTNE